MKIKINSKKIGQIINAKNVEINKIEHEKNKFDVAGKYLIHLPEDLYDSVVKLIKKNKISKCLEEVDSYLMKNKKDNSIIIKLAQEFNTIKLDKIKNTISGENYDSKMSIIVDRILSIMKKEEKSS